MTKTNTFREHLHGAILETCDLWDIWSEWLGEMTWPKKDNDKDKDNDNDKNKDNDKAFKEHPERVFLEFVALETFDQSDKGTWPDQQKDNNKDKDNDNDKDSDKDI